MRPLRVAPLLALLALLAAPAALARYPAPADEHQFVRSVTITYRAHDGAPRHATVLMPAHLDTVPAAGLPLIISPHGRGVDGRLNSRLWGDLPGKYGFVLVSPDGEGRKLGLYSWGAPGQIDDLARMPQILRETLPWLRIDRKRVYAFGGSMGGQEALILLAEHPRLLAGVAAFDAPTDMAGRYRAFAQLPDGPHIQRLARLEMGGTPLSVPQAYAVRSPDSYARAIAFSGVSTQIWWSTRDQVIRDQRFESGRLYERIKELNPSAPVEQCKGMWLHTAEMEWFRRLPAALGHFGLRPPPPVDAPASRLPR